MIGVVASPADLDVAEEFFELFKTPWESAVSGRRYEVVLATEEYPDDVDAAVLLVYGAGERAVDRRAAIASEPASDLREVEWAGAALPLYGSARLFAAGRREAVLTSGAGVLDYRLPLGRPAVWRIGYDLFREVRHLLTEGQPACNAATPTLELHIAILRSLLLEAGVAFVEIPPRPADHQFICCLTHDVDFFGIGRHRFDRTLAGFAARASVGTLVDCLRGRRPAADVIRNWGALLSLPLIWMGVVRDIWQPFEDYARAEAGRPSTFFLVPFNGRAGVAADGTVAPDRAVPYGIREIRADVQSARDAGAELAVHGIDAWRDADAGRAELHELTPVTGQATAGIRMHWLYFAPDSPVRLEAAGFEYDSTWGYNEAVGYRAGTSQVFRLPATRSLMELPMSIMDSALFYADRMGLAGDAALEACRRIIAKAVQYGGTVVVNWHCRSLAPERLWGPFYRQLLCEMGENGRAWFATASDTVAWFRWRRSIHFSRDTGAAGITVAAAAAATGPAALVRIHRPSDGDRPVEEMVFDGRQELRLAL
jgi:hypothetical protein